MMSQCQAITRNSNQCKKKAVEGSQYCSIPSHQNQAKNNTNIVYKKTTYWLSTTRNRFASFTAFRWLKWSIGVIFTILFASFTAYMEYGTDIKIVMTQPSNNPYNTTVTLENSGLRTKVTEAGVIIYKLKHQGRININRSYQNIGKNFPLGQGGSYSRNFSVGGDGEGLRSAKVCVVVYYIFIWKRIKHKGFYYDPRNKVWAPHIC